MPKQTIFEIVDDFDALFQLAYDAQDSGDETAIAEAEKLLETFKDDLVENLEMKLDNYAYVVADAKAKADGIKEEQARLAKLKRQYENKQKSLKGLMMMAMVAARKEKIDTGLHKFSVGKAGGKQSITINTPPELLPEEYRIEEIIYSADKDAIREALQNDQQVPGCILEDRAMILRIR